MMRTLNAKPSRRRPFMGFAVRDEGFRKARLLVMALRAYRVCVGLFGFIGF